MARNIEIALREPGKLDKSVISGDEMSFRDFLFLQQAVVDEVDQSQSFNLRSNDPEVRFLVAPSLVHIAIFHHILPLF